jgi:hypothetical protein
MTKELAGKIYNHLLTTKQGFCFYDGGIVSMGDCEKILEINSDSRYEKNLGKEYNLII